MKEVDTNELIRKAEELLHQLRTKDTAESVGSTSTAPRAQQPATMANSSKLEPNFLIIFGSVINI